MSIYENAKTKSGIKDTDSGIEAAVRQHASRECTTDGSALSPELWEECVEHALMRSPEKPTWRAAWMFFSSRMAPYVLSSIIGGVITGWILLSGAGSTQPVTAGRAHSSGLDSAVASRANYRPDRFAAIPENKRSYLRSGASARYVVEPGTRARFHVRDDSARTLLVSQGNLLWSTDSTGGYQATVTPHGVLETNGALLKVEINEFETEIQVLKGSIEVTAKEHKSMQRFEEGSMVIVGTAMVSSTKMDTTFISERRLLYEKYIRWLDNAQKSVL